MLLSERILGVLFAFYFLVGRWTPERLAGDDQDAEFIWQPRVWAVGLIVLLTGYRVLQEMGAFSRHCSQASLVPSSAWYAAVAGLLLQIYMMTTALWAPWGMSHSQKPWEMLLLILVQVCLCHLVAKGDLRTLRDFFWRAMTAATFFLAVAGAVASVTGRAAVLGGGPNAFGRNMGLLMLGSLYLFDRGTGTFPFRSWVYGFPVALGGLLVVLSGSRGAMLSVVAAFVVLLLLNRSFQLRQAWCCVAVVALSLVMIFYTDIGRDAVDSFRVRIVEMTFEDRYTSDRDDLFRNALEAGLENPLFGLGLDGFRAVRSDEYPHNFFLEVFAEGGGAGLLLALLLLSVVLGHLWKWQRMIDPSTVAAFCLVLAAAQFSGDLFDSRGVFLFSLFALVPRDFEPAECGPSLAAATIPRAALHSPVSRPAC